jgi:hypothetical protein
MALRPLSFGLRFREKGRTLRVRANQNDPKRYVVEVERRGQQTRRRDHASLAGAVQDFAQTWRERLH